MKIAILLAVITLAVGVIALRDTAITLGWLHGQRWTDTMATTLPRLHVSWPFIPIAVCALIIGTTMIICAIRPRRKTAIALNTAASVWMAPQHIARLATHAARTTSHAGHIRATATRRTVTITATATDPATAAHTKTMIATAVEHALAILARPPRVRVRITTGTSR